MERKKLQIAFFVYFIVVYYGDYNNIKVIKVFNAYIIKNYFFNNLFYTYLVR